MNKSQLFTLLFQELETSLAIATKAANDARDLATHEQSKPETQYDTVGLEASYLAHGQSQRVNELQLAIENWQDLQSKAFNEHSHIQVGALVQLNDNETDVYYLIGNASGGLKLNIDGEQVMVISVHSPIGKKLADKQIGDEISLPAAPSKYLEITNIY